MFDLSFSRVASGNRGGLLAAGLLLMAMPSISESFANALGTYVHEPDASFAWKRTEHKKIKGATLTHLELISQTWRGNLWSHDLLIVRPTTLRQTDIAMLFIADDGYDARDEKRPIDSMKWRNERARSSRFSARCRTSRSTMVLRKTA